MQYCSFDPILLLLHRVILSTRRRKIYSDIRRRRRRRPALTQFLGISPKSAATPSPIPLLHGRSHRRPHPPSPRRRTDAGCRVNTDTEFLLQFILFRYLEIQRPQKIEVFRQSPRRCFTIVHASSLRNRNPRSTTSAASAAVALPVFRYILDPEPN